MKKFIQQTKNNYTKSEVDRLLIANVNMFEDILRFEFGFNNEQLLKIGDAYNFISKNGLKKYKERFNKDG